MIKINVYDDNDEVVKTVTAEPVNIMFGPVRSVMSLLKTDNITTTYEMMTAVCNAYDELFKVLSKAFPEIEENEWNHVRMDELVIALMSIMRDTFRLILAVPKDPT